MPVQPTTDEIVSALRNSSLPTLIVEGRSDMAIYRDLEEHMFNGVLDIFSTGGRRILLEIFERRSEFQHLPVAFLADSDLYAFHGLPEKYKGVVFTAGFSIENDVLAGGKALKFVKGAVGQRWISLVGSLSYWFASIVERTLVGESPGFAEHPSQYIDFKDASFTKIGGAALIYGPLQVAASIVLREPLKYIRGHSLLDALGHFLAVHKQKPRMSKDALLYVDIIAWEENSALRSLEASIRAALKK